MRHSMANENKFKKGPSTKYIGSTQGSVSERSIDEDAIIAAAVSEVKAPNPTFVEEAKSIITSSTGDACKEEFLMNDVVEVAVKVGITRPAFWIGANAALEWTAASTVAMVSKMVIIA